MRCLKATWIPFVSATMIICALASANDHGSIQTSSLQTADAGASLDNDVPIDPELLWLPKSYREFNLGLFRAAEAALALERCAEIKSGTIDLAQGNREHPIYRILCRQTDGKTYNEMVDGITYKTLVTQEVSEEVLIQRAEPALAATCYEDVLTKVVMMIDIEWVSPKRPQPLELTNDYAIYRWDFNSQSVDDQELQYKAVCRVTMDKVATTKISSRRLEH